MIMTEMVTLSDRSCRLNMPIKGIRQQVTVSTMISPEGIRQLFHRMEADCILRNIMNMVKRQVKGTAQAGYIAYMTAQAEESASRHRKEAGRSTSMMRQAMSQGL